jgi:hypothetical protein
MVMRASGARFKRRRPLGVIAADQLVYPVPGEPIVAGDLAFAAPFEHDGGDDAFDMADLPQQQRRQLCRETSVNYVVESDTVPATSGNGPRGATSGVIFMPDGHGFGHISLTY